jgi:hypothetical protein
MASPCSSRSASALPGRTRNFATSITLVMVLLLVKVVPASCAGLTIGGSEVSECDIAQLKRSGQAWRSSLMIRAGALN